MKEIVQDLYGNTIYLTDERWQHIVQRHPVLQGYKNEVLKTIRSGKREQDAFYPYKFYYRKAFKNLPRRFTHIEVVIIFGFKDDQPNNFATTAYPMIIV